MNKVAALCRAVAEGATSQRQLAGALSVSLGQANQLVAEARKAGYLSADGILTTFGNAFLDQFRVGNAIILAAGFGSRFVPFTYDTPKGLLPVKGTPMIERQIEQLHQAGVTDITIVVGYLKEAFDYLIDKYGVELVYNPEYATKNNFVSLYYALDRLGSTYLLMADNWIENNIFHHWELQSWFSGLFYEGPTAEWGVELGKHDLIRRIDTSGKNCWAIVGPAYFTPELSATFAPLVRQTYTTPGTDNWYWEHILREHLANLPIYLNRQSHDNVHEFESLEELRCYDHSYADQTTNTYLGRIGAVLDVSQSEIHDLTPLKEGLTNTSFSFCVRGERYIFRRPGDGTDKMIDREAERQIYQFLEPYDLTDQVVWFDASGQRITRFYDQARVSDAWDDTDLATSMALVHNLHDLRLVTGQRFDIAAKMRHFLAGLAELGVSSPFADFDAVYQRAQQLLARRDALGVTEILCHGDYANTNVLIFPDGSARLIDFEFAGMADPIMDVAMYGLYSYFDRSRFDLSLRLWKAGPPSRQETMRLYLYVALGGFLWSLYAVMIQAHGTQVGDYTLKMYRYMKDYDAILRQEGFLEG